MTMYRLLLLLYLFNPISSLNCTKCIINPLIPLQESCSFCESIYCYRLEYTIKYPLDKTTSGIAIEMGCIDFPTKLTMGCRKNIDGDVLCLCSLYSLCNEEESIDIITLPIFNCKNELYVSDDREGNGKTCRSNQCITYREANSGMTSYRCQEGQPILTKFDIYSIAWHIIPSSMCITYQNDDMDIYEECSCPHQSDNCTTPTVNIGSSTHLTLANNSRSMITCSLRPIYDMTRRTCKGDACFVLSRPYRDNMVGCITYDYRFLDRQYIPGTYNILDEKLFICNTNMCNQNKDQSIDISNGLSSSSDCNCLPPSLDRDHHNHESSSQTSISFILSISIPSIIILSLIIFIIIYRVIRGTWPFYQYIISSKTNHSHSSTPVISIQKKVPIDCK